MSYRYTMAVVSAAAIAFISCAAIAAGASHKPGDTVTFCGMVSSNGECTMIKSGDETFVINGITPTPQLNKLIKGQGYVGKPMTVCVSAGTALHSAMWQEVSDCTM